MPAATLDADIDVDTRQLVSLLENLISAVAHTDGFWDDLAAWWYQRQTDWLSTANLTPNAPSTLARKGDRPPLVDSGALRDSSRLNQPFNINRGLDGSATFGLRKGTDSYRKAILARSGARGAPTRLAVPPINVADSVEVAMVLREWFERILDGA